MSQLPEPFEDEYDDGYDDDPGLFFPNAYEFVIQYLLPSWRHTYSGARWCAHWWRHAEAVSRLDALWRAFEAHRHGDPSGMAVWWRDFADPLMATLTAENGTFAQCDAKTGDHAQNRTWPTAEPPAAMFIDERAIRPRSAAVIDE